MATEYKVTVKPTGGDYTSLEASVNANETNLTTSNVINGSLTRGAISGAIKQTTTNATATMISKTATQMLVGAITGAANNSNTWYPTADGNDTTNCWTPTTAGDSVQLSVEIDGTWSSADTTAVTIHNYTTDATRYINIYTTSAARHNGIAQAVSGLSSYRHDATGYYGTAISILSQYIRLSGIEIFGIHSQYSLSYSGINITSTGDYSTISHCIVHDSETADNHVGISSSGSAPGCVIYNNIVYSFRIGFSFGIQSTGVNRGFNYNNTSYGNVTGFNFGNTNILSNNIGYNNTTDFSGTAEATSTNNLSKDTTAPPLNTYYVSKTLTFVGTGAGAENFHLVSTDTDAIDKGADLSGTFTDDIDGVTRSGTWDIGADEYVAAATGWVNGGKLKNII